MKVTAKIKNLKDHIIGYFSKESGEFNYMTGIYVRSGSNLQFAAEKEPYMSVESDTVYPSNFDVIRVAFAASGYKTIIFSKNLKNKFRILMNIMGGNARVISENGELVNIESTYLYEYNPINWNDSEIHSTSIYKKIGILKFIATLNPNYSAPATTKIDIYAEFPRNDI